MTATIRAVETYVGGGKVRKLIYRVQGSVFVVLVEYPYFEQPRPDVFRFRTIDEARRCWREQRVKMACQGYERRAN